MKTSIINLIIGSVLLLTSCTSNKKDDSIVITERIVYPVFIKSPYDEEGDWSRENIEGQKREAFVKMIFDAAYSGKAKAYDYLSYKPLTPAQVKAMCNKSDTIHVITEVEPYREYDTVIANNLNFLDIHRITFMEEWTMDKNKFAMYKKVVGIAPAITKYEVSDDSSNDVRGYQPLFWLFLDDRYPKILTSN